MESDDLSLVERFTSALQVFERFTLQMFERCWLRANKTQEMTAIANLTRYGTFENPTPIQTEETLFANNESYRAYEESMVFAGFGIYENWGINHAEAKKLITSRRTVYEIPLSDGELLPVDNFRVYKLESFVSFHPSLKLSKKTSPDGKILYVHIEREREFVATQRVNESGTPLSDANFHSSS